MNPRNSLAANATLHCLTGCAISEIAGLMIGTALGLRNAVTIALAIGLAFLFGYALSTLPLISAGASASSPHSAWSSPPTRSPSRRWNWSTTW